MTTTGADYWENRARRFGEVDRGLPAVCSYGMPRLYNEAIHVAQLRALAPFLAFSGRKVLDVGCGIGRWSLRLSARGNQVLGVDISPRMVALARQRNAARGLGASFRVSDISGLELGEKFDVVLSVTVLQHVVSEAAFCSALQTLARHLKPDGELIVLEAAPDSGTTRCNSGIFDARSAAVYREQLAAAGFAIVDEAGVDIAPLRPVLLPAMKSWPRWLARTLPTLTAVASLPIDMAFAGRHPDLCWHKIFVARKRT